MAGPPLPAGPRKLLPQPVFSEPVPVFSEGTPTPDPSGFTTPHPSDSGLYKQIQSLLYKDAVAFDPASGSPSDVYPMASAYGAHGGQVSASIAAAGAVVFHAVGDTGASRSQTYPGELNVADHLAADCQTTVAADRPAFLYLLGDLVYDFGESKFYYDQFYEPFRNYPGPIFALPGNHESFVIPNTPPDQIPLKTFERNFCSPTPEITPEAGPLHRTSMSQPGVYFALDVAPLVRIIGLFSNALEDPGVISSINGKWSGVPDVQLAFLAAQLQRIKSESFPGAVILATHHPSFSYARAGTGPSAGGAIHGSSVEMLGQIDSICAQAGVYPHAFLSGHAHNYQRYTRRLAFGSASYEVPFVVCGTGGHDVNPVSTAGTEQQPNPAFGTDVSYLDAGHAPAVTPNGPLTLERYDQWHYGFLRIRVDGRTLLITHQPISNATSAGSADAVTVSLADHSLVTSTSPAKARPSRPGSTRPAGKNRR